MNNMIKTTYRLIITLCLLAMTQIAIAKPEAEFKRVTKAWTLHADGSQEYRHSMELTLYTHTAMNSTYGESFIVYNPEFQELKIHSSYTRQKDGKIVKSPANAFVEVLPSFAAEAPAYNHLKEMVVVHTGLELGATIHLDYSIITKAGFSPALDINELLEESSPVTELEASITVPQNSPLTWQLVGCTAKVNEKVENGSRVYSWKLRGVKASSRETFQPANHDESPRLLASSHKSNSDALSFLASRLKSAVSYESDTFGGFISENAKSQGEKCEIILNHVVNNMGTSGVPLNHAAFGIRDIDTALRSAYGTLLEKTALLNVMLNGAGIKSEIVALYPSYAKSEACGLSAIKDFAVKANVDGEERYLSATSMQPSRVVYRGALETIKTLSGNTLEIEAKPLKVRESKSVEIDTEMAQNGHIILELPAVRKGLDSWGMATLSSQREGIFEVPSMLNEEITYRIKLKDGCQLLTPTDERRLDTPYGSYYMTITQKGDEIEVVRSITIERLQFTPQQYGDVRLLINEWVNSGNRLLLFNYYTNK